MSTGDKQAYSNFETNRNMKNKEIFCPICGQKMTFVDQIDNIWVYTCKICYTSIDIVLPKDMFLN